MSETIKNPVRVLLVDDNDTTRALLRSILVREQYLIVGEAKNGEQAIEYVERCEPDIICLDIQMPKMDGLEALQKIKEQHPDVAVVMVTGSTERETVQAAIENGAGGYIVKPFNIGRVLDTLKRVLASEPTHPKPKTHPAPAEGEEPAPADADAQATPAPTAADNPAATDHAEAGEASPSAADPDPTD
jgi:two-component system chemotaxis response regulator CheY